MRRTLLAGGLIAAVYLAASVGTGLAGRRVRPLFEGFSPPAAYQWVAPPARFASGNQKPAVSNDTITVTAGRSNQAAPATGDGQLALNFPAGAVNAAGATAIKVRITPLDPATLGALPPGLFPDGNAYHVELTLDPTGQPVTALDTPGNLIMQLPAVGHTVLFSPDGKAWTDLQAKPASSGSTTMGGVIKNPGFFLGAASADVNGQLGTGKSSGSSSTGTIILAAVVVVLVIAILAGPLVYRRLRGGPATGRSGGRGGSRPRGGSGSGSGSARPAARRPSPTKKRPNRNRRRR